MFTNLSAPQSRVSRAIALLALASLGVALPAGAQSPVKPPSPPTRPAGAPASGAGVDVPPEYVIGPQDVLGINFWRDADMTGDVTVRPDGRITLPLIGDVTAAGLTPEQLKKVIQQGAAKLIEDPTITVIVRQINSRKVFITGQVTTPGAHVLTGPLTVMQLISLAGGLTEYAKKKEITVMRTEPNGKQTVMPFNYNDVAKGKNLSQNIVLKPGDTVVVP
jgi:polysaccharide biosynthesis/export protein